MSRDFPDLIDPWKAADGKRTFQGNMPLKRMKRLTPLLVSVEGTADFRACFGYDEQKDVVVDLYVSAELVLICQRSLEPYGELVRRSSRLLVIEDLAEQDLMPDNYDAVLVENGRLALLEAVEDELLLGIPQVPVNPAVKEIELSTDDGARPAFVQKKELFQRPFAGLADMLKDKADGSGT
jgi:uncharacterized protein